MNIEKLLEQLRGQLSIDKKCWKNGGCPFNSNTSWRYKKCWQDDYSVEECMFDNIKDFLDLE